MMTMMMLLLFSVLVIVCYVYYEYCNAMNLACMPGLCVCNTIVLKPFVWPNYNEPTFN